MEDYIVNWVISGVLFWTATFLLVRNVFRNRSFDFCNRVVSTIHAAVAVGLASLSVQHWGCPVCPLASRSSELQIPRMDNSVHHIVGIVGIAAGLAYGMILFAAIFSLARMVGGPYLTYVTLTADYPLLIKMKALAVTLSYLIYDLICCLFDKIPRMDNSVHHIVGIVGIAAGLAYGMCGSEMVAAMWLTEISSPFLHMRELLKELGYRDTNLTLAFDILFAAIFSLARMVGGPYLTYVTLTADYPLLIKAMALGLQLVSAFWFYKILRMILFAAIFSLARMVGGPYLTYVTLTADYPLLIKAMALGLQLVSAFWFYKILRMVRYKIAKRMAPNKSIKISVH
ncbi:hypothetical protein C4D60_Mb10t09730 [Musa balbisiana]|uniref:TLC domain-containing protein n=1 Tax=Musa balbisiana TaxID=52838 RepID=A0A4S8IVW0_MUSBA|nr:hypothetical protein C4D60_Mb10t09730 [Musa balbisiana]